LAYPASPNKRSEEEGTDNATQTKKQPETAKKKKKKRDWEKGIKRKIFSLQLFFPFLFFGNLFVPNSDFYEIVNAWKLTSTVANVADLLLFISASTNRWFTDFYNFFFLLVFWECL
jgi:hypothetical protein